MAADVISSRRRRRAERVRPEHGEPGQAGQRRVRAADAAAGQRVLADAAPAARSATIPSTLLTYGGPVSHDPVTVSFKQTIGANDALRTGAYSKTLTFTLSTTTP